MKRNRLVLLALTGAMALSAAFSGCSSGNESASTESSQTSVTAASESTSADISEEEEPISFTWYGNYDWFSSDSTWGTKKVGEKWILENKHVKIDFIGPNGSAQAKLATFIASDQYPDVMILDKGPDVEKLVSAQKIVAFDDWVDKYQGLKKEATEPVLNILRSADGKLYQFPNWYMPIGKTSPMNGTAGWAYVNKYYKELGSPKLENTDDLYAYLKAVKQKYPDVIPLMPEGPFASADIIYSAFGGSPSYLNTWYAYPDGDQMKFIFDDPKFKETMVYVNKLQREKLTDSDVFTRKKETITEKIMNKGFAMYVSGDVTNPICTSNNNKGSIEANDPENGFTLTWPIYKEGVDKNNLILAGSDATGWNVSVITKDAKDPERIYKFLDWLTTVEGQRILTWGEQGLYYDEVDSDGVPVLNEKYYNTPVDQLNTWGSNWVGNSLFTDIAQSRMNDQLPEDKRDWGITSRSHAAWKQQKDFTEFNSIVPLPTSPEGKVYLKIKDLVKDQFTKAYYAKSEAEVLEICSKASQEAAKIGVDSMLQAMTDRWQKNKVALGK